MIRMAWRLLWREARSGELTLIFLALLLAITSTTAIALFSSRLELAMQQRSSELLGADVRLHSTTELPPQWQQQAQALGLKSAQTLSFPSVVLFGDAMSLAAIKAVDDHYPLRSVLQVTSAPEQAPQRQSHGPAPGEAWVEARLLALLGAQLGDQVEVGNLVLTLSGEIREESDRGGNFYSLSPRLMMHWDDVPASGLTGPGARLNYRLLVTGDAESVRRWQESQPLAANQRFESLDDGNQAVARNLNRARQYLGIAALLAVVLASVAVAISAQRYASRHFDISALMRTFGLQQRQVWGIYASQLLLLGVVATLAGLLLASGLQALLLQLLQGLVPEDLPAAPFTAWLLGMSSGLLTLLGFALPYLMPLSRVAPLRVLRRDLAPVPLAGWMITALALAALTLLLWLFTGDALMSVGTLLGGGILLLLMLVLLLSVIRVLRRLLAGRPLPLSLRFAWLHISRNSRQSAGQILAFSLTLMVMLVIATLRNDLLADWQANLPEKAPNVFAINIQPYQQQAFADSLAAAGLQHEKLYPMVPGRLLRINDVSVQDLQVADDPAINRDLALTADDQLPASNRVVAGDWQAQQTGKAQVSVEQRLAERLGIRLGDRLTFSAGGSEFSVDVSSLREVDWGAMTPNFYMMFSPDVLAALPASYLTSFYVPAGKQSLLTDLIRTYPGITMLDMQAVIGQIQSVLQQVTLAIELILIFVLVAALMVMLSSLLAGLSERLREGAIVRTLGGSRALLRRGQRLEFMLLGAVSALLALTGAELVTWLLYQQLLDLPYRGPGLVWLWLPPLAALLLALPGLWLLRRTVEASPLMVLRGLNE